MKKFLILTLAAALIYGLSGSASAFTDDFEDGILAPWVDLEQTTYGPPNAGPITESGGVLHVGSAHWALSPDVGTVPPYKMSVEVNFQGETWLEMFCRTDGTQGGNYQSPSGLRFDYWNGNLNPTDWGAGFGSFSYSLVQALTGFTGGTYIYEVDDQGTTIIAKMIDSGNPSNFAQTIITGITAEQGFGYQFALGVDPGGPGWPTEKTITYDNFNDGAIENDPVGTIDPCSISISEPSGSDTYTLSLIEQPPAGATFAVYLDPCDLWANGLQQATVTHNGATTGTSDPNTALDIKIDSSNYSDVTITVTAFNDSIGEGPVDLTLGHSLVQISGSPVDPETDPNWAAPGLANSNVAVSVADDDQRYAVTVDEIGGLEVSEQGPTSDDFTVGIEKSPTITLTVDLATDGETTLSQNALVFNSGNWDIPQTVTVTAVDDTVGEATPLTSDITYTVDSGATWATLLSDDFNNTAADGWTTYTNEAGDANAVHDGAQLLTYGSTMALAPGDYTAPYRLTVECDLGSYTYNVIYCRNDGISHNYENGDVIRMGWWDGGGGSLVLNIAGDDQSLYGVPMPGRGTDPNVYRFIIEDEGETVKVRMENVANPSNYLEVSASGDYAALGAGEKIALGMIEDDGVQQGEYIKYDNFLVETLSGSTEQLGWANALIEVVGDLDGDAEVLDNDCSDDDYTDNDADFDDDCDIDLVDFAVFADQYLDCLLPNGGLCY